MTTLNDQGRVAKAELTGLHPTRQEYDPQGRVTAVKDVRDRSEEKQLLAIGS